MLRWLYVAVHLLTEAGAARRDARIRFLKAQVEKWRCRMLWHACSAARRLLSRDSAYRRHAVLNTASTSVTR
jgi:hypothetical protein